MSVVGKSGIYLKSFRSVHHFWDSVYGTPEFLSLHSKVFDPEEKVQVHLIIHTLAVAPPFISFKKQVKIIRSQFDISLVPMGSYLHMGPGMTDV